MNTILKSLARGSTLAAFALLAVASGGKRTEASSDAGGTAAASATRYPQGTSQRKTRCSPGARFYAGPRDQPLGTAPPPTLPAPS